MDRETTKYVKSRAHAEENERKSQFDSMMAEIEDSSESESDDEPSFARTKSNAGSFQSAGKGREVRQAKTGFGEDDDSDDDEEHEYISAAKSIAAESEFGEAFSSSKSMELEQTNLPALRSFILRPIEMSDRLIQCYIERDRSGVNMIHPLYKLYLDDGKQFLLSAQKRTKNKTSNYLFSMSEKPKGRSSTDVIGKLRSNWSGSEYAIYDHGLNPKNSTLDVHSRKVLGLISFQYDKMGPGKMIGCIPHVADSGKAFQWKDGEGEQDGATLMSKQLLDNNSEKLMFLRNKRPKYDPKFDGHVLNFHGRVTMSSVKNFQMSCDASGEDTVLQFGRVSCQPPGPEEQCSCHKNHFNMDFKFPLSPFQAFSICIAALDGKIADSKSYETLSSFKKRK